MYRSEPLLPADARADSVHSEYKRIAAFDGVNKLNHYEKAGAASVSITSPQCTYFAAGDQEAQQVLGCSLQDYVAAGATADEPEDNTCTVNLSCARVDGSSSGPCDIKGVVGGTCAHTIPIRGMFIDMRTAECFVFYIILLTSLLKSVRPNTIQYIYIDFACRLKSSWGKYLSNRPSLPAWFKSVVLLVNWLHACAHDLGCQLSNSGRYAVGAGHRDGEHAERLWSMTKVCGAMACCAWQCYSLHPS